MDFSDSSFYFNVTRTISLISKENNNNSNSNNIKLAIVMLFFSRLQMWIGYAYTNSKAPVFISLFIVYLIYHICYFIFGMVYIRFIVFMFHYLLLTYFITNHTAEYAGATMRIYMVRKVRLHD